MGKLEDLKVRAGDVAEKMGKAKNEFDRLQAELQKLSADIAKEQKESKDDKVSPESNNTQKAG